MRQRGGTHSEARTARLTILIDPRKKAVLERLCAAEDVTPSQLLRKLIRSFIEQRLGRPWRPDDETGDGGSGRAPGANARRARPTRRR
jgi:hypothetical protein